LELLISNLLFIGGLFLLIPIVSPVALVSFIYYDTFGNPIVELVAVVPFFNVVFFYGLKIFLLPVLLLVNESF
jgi:hypothetical protein